MVGPPVCCDDRTGLKPCVHRLDKEMRALPGCARLDLPPRRVAQHDLIDHLPRLQLDIHYLQRGRYDRWYSALRSMHKYQLPPNQRAAAARALACQLPYLLHYPPLPLPQRALR